VRRHRCRNAAPATLFATVARASVLALLLAASVSAQSIEPADSPNASRLTAADVGKFLAGGAIGLGIHESGHVLTALVLDAHPGVKGISFGPIPFFAITHRSAGPGHEYAISSAGFWAQGLASEWILSKRPHLKDENAPVLKGVLAFHVLASAAYGVAAATHIGPPERDTLAMSESLRWKEGWVGAVVIAPAVLDAWRYYRRDAAWARWSSRAAKVGMVLLLARAAR
jgi:hypothetical protein